MMKKIFALVFILVLGKMSYSQGYPISQNLGSDSTIVISKGALQSRLAPIVISDTTAANNQRIKNYPGAQLYTANGDFYVRNATATKWVLVSSGSSGPINIYNSDGTLTGNRVLTGAGNSLTFSGISGLGINKVADSVFTVEGGIHATGGLRLENLTSSPGTKALRINSQGVVSVADTTISGGTVTQINTNNATGITGGPITTSGTLAIDTTLISTRAWRQKGIDSVANLPRVTSVGLTMPVAFNVAGSPVTNSGTLAVTAAGLSTQYIRGDGQLANFPGGGGGGGSSVVYYFNGGTNQGTFVGNTYYEMSKTAIVGTAANFTINADGYITQFITDAGDPALLNIPAGNWNFEMYFSASSGGGSPSFYVELYKYDGTTFTLISSSSSSPEGITGGTATDLYLTALAVPATSLTLTDRLAVRVYVTHSGRTITLHTQDNTLCQVTTTFTTGITALNGLTEQVQYFATGTSGTDFNISSASATHTFNLPTASATNRGALSTTDWSTFNNKVGGSLISGYITKATGTNTIDTSQIFQSGQDVGIGTLTPNGRLAIVDTGGFALKINYNSASSVSDSNAAIYAENNGLSSYVAILNERTTNNTGAQLPLLIESSLTTGTPQANMGTGMDFGTRDDANNRKLNRFIIRGTDPAAATYTSRAEFRLWNAGSQTTPYYWLGNGNMGLGTSTPDSNLTVVNGAYFQRGIRASGLPSAPGTKALRIDASGTLSYADTLIDAGGTVTSIATNNGTGITGGTITTTGTLAIDTLLISTRAWRQKGVDSVAALVNSNVSGTTNRVSKFTGANTIGNSSIADSSSSVAMTILSNGNIGINTTAPNERLEIVGTSRFTRTTSPSVYLNISMENGFAEYDARGSIDHVWENGGVENMRLALGGNLGIGTASPDSMLTVLQGARFQRGVRMSGLPSAPGTKALRIDANGTLSVADTTTGGGGIGGSGTTNYLPKFTASTTLGDSRFFDNGSVTFLGNGDVNATPSTGIFSGTGGTGTNIAGAELRIRGGASTGNAAGGIISFYTSAAGSSGTGVNAATERMRIDANGNLGLGVTPSASWASGYRAFEFGNTSTQQGFLFSNGINDTWLGSNSIFNGSNWTRIGTGFATGYEQVSGEHTWQYAASGSAGTTFSFTVGMRLNASGNLGIATSTIGSRLQVNGNAAIGYSASTAAPTNGLAVAGNVGVGTLTPGTVAGYQTIQIQGSTTGALLEMWGNAARILQVNANINDVNIYGATNIPMIFYTNTVERLRITNTGSVFIGNGETASSPSTGIISGTGGTGTNIAGAEFRIRGGASTGSGAGGPITFYTSAAGSAGTSTNAATEVARFDTRGNLGLGVVPAAWGSLTNAIQLKSGIGIFSNTSGLGGLANNVYAVPGTNDFYITSNFATRYYQYQGEHVWQTAASGIANNAITFTTGMYLNSSSNLGIGTTTIGSKLQVNGNAAIGYSTSTAAPANGLLVSGNISGGTNYATRKVNLNMSSQSTFAAASFTFPNAGVFTTGEVNVFGTNDVFFQGLPATTSGFTVLEDYNGGGLQIGTGGTAKPIIFNINRVERMRLDASSNLGIGTATIGSRLQVNGNAAIGYSASTAAPTNGLLVAGNTGIGTTSPSSYSNLTTLTINGTNGSVIDLKTGNTLYGELYSLANEFRIDAVGASSVLKFLTNSVTRMTLDASGNLGIGTTTIGSRLQVNGGAAIGYSASTAAPTNGLAVSGNVGIGIASATRNLDIRAADPGMTLRSSNTTGFCEIYFGDSAGEEGRILYGNNGDYMALYTTSAERIRITSNGEMQLKPAANTAALTTSGQYSLTGANAQSLLDLAGTWNTTGNPTAIKLNITNTASGASAYLMDLQVGGTTQFRVAKDGAIRTTAPTGGTADNWKFGTKVASSVVFDDNDYLEVEVGGTLYRVALVNLAEPEPDPEPLTTPDDRIFREPVRVKAISQSDNQKIKDLEKELAELKEMIKSIKK